jgi:hypothetical protein
MAVNSGVDPTQIFDSAVGYFNAANWKSLRPLLHGQVILDHLHSNGNSAFGADGPNGAMAALKASGAQMSTQLGWSQLRLWRRRLGGREKDRTNHVLFPVL